ncbi:MAG: DUF4363 family protein [Eubacteriales bacterium]|nr:DUF4363 family protein [Eubacteriales bacterium]
MKRLWTALVLLACIVAGGAYNLYTVSHTVDSIVIPLEQATAAAQADDLTSAGRLTQQAQQAYLEQENYLSAVLSEKLLDEVRLGFARATEGVRAGDNVQLAMELAGLRQAVEDLMRAESIGYGNIF